MPPNPKKQKLTNKQFIDKVYEERLNVSKLAYIISNSEQIGLKPMNHLDHANLSDTVNALKELLNNVSVTTEDFPYGRMEVKYWRYQGDNFGRIYPNKLGYCNLSKPLRHTLSDDLYLDVDIINCHPSIYLFLATKYQIQTQYKLDLSYLEEYINNRANVIEEATSLNSVDQDAIKDWFLKVFSGADAINIGLQMTHCMEQTYMNFSVLRALLCNEFHKEDKYKDLDQTDILRFFSLVIQDYENQIRSILESWCEEHDIVWAVNCFDGGMILKDKLELDLVEIENYVLEKLNIPVKLACKSMDKYRIPIPEEALISFDINYVMAICGKNSNNYDTRKTYFELNNFFCMSSVKYCSEHTNMFYLYNKADFICKYEDISVVETNKKGVDTFVSFIKKWITDESKRKYYMIGLYPPGCIMPKNPVDVSDNLYCYSLWKGWKVEHVPRLPESLENKVLLLRSLTQYLWNGESTYVEYIERYLKRILIKPGEKTGVCIALKAVLGGEGKNTWFEIQSKMFGTDMCTSIQNHERDWFGPFNEVITEKVFVHLEEMNKDHIRKYLKQFLSYITSPTDLINLKGGAKKVKPSYANYFMTFNSAGVDSLPGIQRRLFIHEFLRTQEARPPAYYRELYELMDDHQVMRQYYDYIMSLDLESFELTKFPVTPYMTKLFGNKEELAVQNLSRVESFLVDKITHLFNTSFENEVKFKATEWYEEMKTGCPSQYVTKLTNFYRELSQVLGNSVERYMRQGSIWFKLNLDDAIRCFETKHWKLRSDFMNEEYIEGLLYRTSIPCWKSCEERRIRDSMTVRMSSASGAILYWKRYSKLNPMETFFEHTCSCGGVYKISKE